MRKLLGLSREQKLFIDEFHKNLISFIEQYSLLSQTDRLLVAVSGGIDSMALLVSLKQIQSCGYSNEIKVAHVNHNTRDGQVNEREMVRSLCEHLELDFESMDLEGLNPNRNFEFKARIKRYDALYEVAGDYDRIVLAHHIDDSFEWTMLQSLRSSHLEGLVGIPVINRKIIRPFMCVTKKQIARYVGYLDIPFIEDPTNEILKYERNFIRHEVITAFKDRYPKYLKHYVYRHNELSRRLGLHYIDKNQSSFSTSMSEKGALIFKLDEVEDYSGLENLLLKCMRKLNPNSRGVTALQFSKIITALKNRKYGPLALTNGIMAYLDYNLVYLTKEKASKPQKMNIEAEGFTFEQFDNFLYETLRDKNLIHCFPFIVEIEGKKIEKRKFNFSYNTELLAQLKTQKTCYYPALKLRREWSKKKNRHKKLMLNFYLGNGS